jgi:hypothetical protein
MLDLLPRSGNTREIAETLGGGVDTMIGDVMSRFHDSESPLGTTSRAVQKFYQLTGLNHWIESLKTSASLMLSSHLAGQAGRAFAELNPRLQVTLRRAGIEAAEWDAIRATAARAADGRSYVIPEDVADRAIGDKLQAYFIDQTRIGLSEPTAGTRAMMTLGRRATPRC